MLAIVIRAVAMNMVGNLHAAKNSVWRKVVRRTGYPANLSDLCCFKTGPGLELIRNQHNR